MAPEIEEIKLEIEKALQSLSDQEGSEIIAKLEPLLYTNLGRGRIQGFIEGDLKHVREYVWKVAKNYRNLSTIVHRLQIERSSEIWEPIFLKMQTWAYNFFIRKNFYSDVNTKGIAAECANEAAIIMLNAHFPYDTDLDPWVHTIVLHTCQKYIRRGMLPRKYQANSIPFEELENIPDSATQHFEALSNFQGELSDALSRLPAPRRQVIELMYFSGLSPVEIAGEMGKSVGAVYSLHFNALLDLKKIMSQTGKNINE
jgi:RNA polymerase sigma factor (sigma-70 family)